MIDTAEQKTLLETSGVAMIHKIAQGGKTELLASLNQGIYAPMDPNKRIKYIGLSQPDVKECISISDVTDVVGEPIDSFIGYGNEETVLYLAGCSFPKAYIENLKILSKQNRKEFRKSWKMMTCRWTKILTS